MATSQIRGSTQIKANSVTSGQVDSSIIASAGTNAFTGNQSLGGNRLTNVATPVSPLDTANKAYVDNSVQGLSQKPTARLATSAALPANTYANGAAGVGATLTANTNGALSVDGVVVALNDLIFVKNEAASANNGLYNVTTLGTASVPYVLTRSTNMNTPSEFDGALIPVDNEGTANANTLWLINNLGTVTVGTTAVTFTQLSAPTSYSGSGTITISTSVISVTPASIGPTQLASQPNGTGLKGGAGSSLAIQTSRRETPTGTVNGSNTTFTVANTPVLGQEDVYLNGILQDGGTGNDYTISGAVITFLSAPVSGDKVRVTYPW